MLYKMGRFIVFAGLMLSMSGCFHWWRAYQTYLQMDEFDDHFAISSQGYFTIHFKSPILYNTDFEALAKISPSTKQTIEQGDQVWRYKFWKENADGSRTQPVVSFFFDLNFNREDLISSWRFSPLFLQIAPAEFLEFSLRSLGAGEINQDKRQLKIDTTKLNKIDAALPKKSSVVAALGEPLEIYQEGEDSVYLYHFRLDTMHVEEGYEDRALSQVRIYFDEKTQEMIRMSGRFAGLKLSIRYRNLQKQSSSVI